MYESNELIFDIKNRRFQKARHVGNYSLADERRKTQTQEFIEIYRNLASQGPLDDEKIFEVALEQLQSKRKTETVRAEPTINLIGDFQKASAETQKSQSAGLNLADIYKDTK